MAIGSEALRDGEWPTDQLLPPGQTLSTDTTKTLAETGKSFWFQGEMRAIEPERIMPFEEVLPGVPMPLVLFPNIPSYYWNEDHLWFESQDPRLRGEDRRPLRYSVMQHLPIATHKRKNQLYDAMEIPTEPDRVFQAVLLSVAKYVPHHGVDLSESKPVIREIPESLRRDIYQNGWLRAQPKTHWKIGQYLARYSLQHGLEAIRETEQVEQFLEARNERAKKYASFNVMRAAVQAVLDPFEGTYEVARSQGLIRRPEPTAARMVTQYFDRHQPDYIPAIADRLLVA